MFGMSEYLTIWHELEMVRLADQARKEHQLEDPFPTKIPPSEAGKCGRQRTRRR